MTDAQTTARFEVIQADRDAAAAMAEACIVRSAMWPREARQGERDDDEMVQAFAAHRHHFAGSLPDGAEVSRATLQAVQDGLGVLATMLDKIGCAAGAAKARQLHDRVEVALRPVNPDYMSAEPMTDRLGRPLAAAPEPPERPGWAAGIIHKSGTDCDEPPERFASQDRFADAGKVIEAARAVVAEYPAAAGADPSIVGGDDKPGWGSIRRLAAALSDLPQRDAKEGDDA